MKISVVITTYNLASYLEEALLSVLKQSRKADEIIVADDCSIDNTSEILRRYSDKIIYVKQFKNIGALKNTLEGLKRASGDIVAFLDADDVWLPDKLKKTEDFFLADNSTILVSHDFVRCDEKLNPVEILDETNLNTAQILSRIPKEKWSSSFRESILLRKGFWLGSAYAIRRTSFDLQLFESILFEIGDFHFSYLDMTLGPFIIASNPRGSVKFINEVLFKYRAHVSNSWTSQNKERALVNINRWQVVHKSTFEILRRLIDDKKVHKRYTYLNNELELLKSEYLNQKFKAVFQFIRLMPSLFKEQKLLHEFIRLVVIVLFGPGFLFRVKRSLKYN